MKTSGITAHMVVKNEDQWIWYAISSVLPYVDTFLITDTGSTDKTVEIIKSIHSDKINFTQVKVNESYDVTRVRQSQIKSTTTPWIWLVDGDEIYSEKLASEIVSAARSAIYSIITVRRYDLLGDVYHKQSETVGTYELYGEKGHLVSRLFSLDKLANLHLKGDYPNEGYYFGNDESTLAVDIKNVYITKGYLYHAMYLKRSSLGASISSMFNRTKFKIEKGEVIEDKLPEVFSKANAFGHPLEHRSLKYELLAALITPIKNIKRKLI